MNLKAIYTVSLGEVPLGKVGFEGEQDATHYDFVTDVNSSGLVNIFAKHTSHSTVSGNGGKDHNYVNVHFSTDYTTKKKKKSVDLTYENGKLVKEDVQPPDNRATRPAVSDTAKQDSADLLSFILRLRQMTMQGVQQGQNDFSSKIYDGRRLFQVNGRIMGKHEVPYFKKKVPVITVALRRKPIEGYTASELKSYTSEEPPLYVHFSDDERFIPIRMDITFFFGTVTALLAKECRTGESCLLGIRE